VVQLSRGDCDIAQNFGEEAAANSSGFFCHREGVQAAYHVIRLIALSACTDIFPAAENNSLR